MTDQINFPEEGKQGLPQGINVLTILTFIGSAIAGISAIWQFFSADKSYRDIQKAQENLSEAPAFVKKMLGPEMLEMARKTMEYKVPLLLLNLVGVALCVWGAMEMRKLKKQGFLLWTIGEFLPVIAGFIILGGGMFAGFAVLGMIVPLVFLILYSVNRKHLIY